MQSIEFCKMFEPIAKKFGIEPDGCCWKGELYLYEYPNNHELNPNTVVDCTEDGVGIAAYSFGDDTWRQDKLELPLPDWVFEFKYQSEEHHVFLNHPELFDRLVYHTHYKYDHDGAKLFDKIAEYVEKLLFSRGQLRMQATVELCKLLDNNGLLEAEGK